MLIKSALWTAACIMVVGFAVLHLLAYGFF